MTFLEIPQHTTLTHKSSVSVALAERPTNVLARNP